MALSQDQVDHVAQVLIGARRSAEKAERPDLPLDTIADAYRIQNAVADQFGPVAGWKVGARTPDAEPFCAPLLHGTVVDLASESQIVVGRRIGVEVEIAFRIGRAFRAGEPAPTEDEIFDAISSAHLAIELCDSRWTEPPAAPPWLFADNQNNERLLVGPSIPDWRRISLEGAEGRLMVNGEAIDTPTRNTAGDVMRLLVWLVRHCITERGGLASGTVVTTGSWTGIHWIEPAADIRGRITPVGEIACRIL